MHYELRSRGFAGEGITAFHSSDDLADRLSQSSCDLSANADVSLVHKGETIAWVRTIVHELVIWHSDESALPRPTLPA